MQTHVPAPANQAKQQQTKTVHQPSQLVGEQQSAFVDKRSDVKRGLQLRQLMDKSRQAAEGRALEMMLNNSVQASDGRALQAMLNNSTHSREAQAFQRMANSSARVRPQVQVATTMPVQRVAEEEPLQTKAANENAAQFETKEAQKPNNTGLPNNLKSGIESLSGMGMDHVKVHYNSAQPAQLNAHAYAQGSDIHVAPGQEQHLPHEAWHVVQQAQGRVKPTMQMKAGVAVNDDAGLEAEADAMGAKALQTKAKEYGVLTNSQKTQTVVSPIQRTVYGDQQRMASSKYIRFFEEYYKSQTIYDLTGSRLDAFIAFLDCVEKHWDLSSIDTHVAYTMFDLHLTMGVTTKRGFEEAFADAGVEDHGYDVYDTPAEFDGSGAVVQEKRDPGPSGPKSYGGYTDMLFQKTSPNATIDFDDGLLKSSSKKNNKPGSLVDLSTMMTGGNINLTIVDPHKSHKSVRCPRAGDAFDKKNRDQHFAMADMLYYITHGSKPDRAGTWTWHHLETHYQMVLVDMEVHAKHGHNGGVYIW